MKLIKTILGAFLFLPAGLWAMPPALHVVGNQFETASACPVRLIGIDCDSLEYFPNAGVSPGVLNSVKEAVTYWNANLVRIPLSQDFWNGIANSKGTPSAAAYIATVDSIVAYCNANNVYCDLDLHWSGYSSVSGTTGEAIAEFPMPDFNSTAFWQAVGARYANNPSVLFDLFNEPYPSSWNILANGGPIPAGTGTGGVAFTAYTGVGLQPLLNTVRATAFDAASIYASAGTNGMANNICIVGGRSYAYNFRGMT